MISLLQRIRPQGGAPCAADYARRRKRDLSARRDVHIWADGIYLRGGNLLPKVIEGVTVRNCIEVTQAASQSAA